MQPAHRPVPGSSRHTPMQGEGISISRRLSVFDGGRSRAGGRSLAGSDRARAARAQATQAVRHPDLRAGADTAVLRALIRAPLGRPHVLPWRRIPIRLMRKRRDARRQRKRGNRGRSHTCARSSSGRSARRSCWPAAPRGRPIPRAAETVRFSDVGWTDITSTTAATSVVLERPRLRARDRDPVGAGDLRQPQEPGHRRVPRQLDADHGGGRPALPRGRLGRNRSASISRAPSTRWPCPRISPSRGSRTSPTSPSSATSSTARSTASSLATTATD